MESLLAFALDPSAVTVFPKTWSWTLDTDTLPPLVADASGAPDTATTSRLVVVTSTGMPCFSMTAEPKRCATPGTRAMQVALRPLLRERKRAHAFLYTIWVRRWSPSCADLTTALRSPLLPTLEGRARWIFVAGATNDPPDKHRPACCRLSEQCSDLCARQQQQQQQQQQQEEEEKFDVAMPDLGADLLRKDPAFTVMVNLDGSDREAILYRGRHPVNDATEFCIRNGMKAEDCTRVFAPRMLERWHRSMGN